LLLAVGTLLLHHIQQRHSLLHASIYLPSTLTASQHHPFCFQSCALRHLDLVHFRESFTRLSGYSLLHLSLEQYSETLLLCFQCLFKYPTLPFSPMEKVEMYDMHTLCLTMSLQLIPLWSYSFYYSWLVVRGLVVFFTHHQSVILPIDQEIDMMAIRI
jgi:hypothetical protein